MPEAKLVRDDAGAMPEGDGWFILNARDGRWMRVDGMGACCFFENGRQWNTLGLNVSVLQAGEAGAMYHRERWQEGFFVLAGAGVAIVEGEERPLRQWDYFHCPADTPHVLVATGDAPFVYVAVGARGGEGDWGAYTVDETAAKFGASVREETTSGEVAYAGRSTEFVPYPGGLPDYDSRSAR